MSDYILPSPQLKIVIYPKATDVRGRKHGVIYHYLQDAAIYPKNG